MRCIAHDGEGALSAPVARLTSWTTSRRDRRANCNRKGAKQINLHSQTGSLRPLELCLGAIYALGSGRHKEKNP